MMLPLSLTLFSAELSDSVEGIGHLEPDKPAEVFHFFKSHPLFNWRLNHNFCEARAEAQSLLLEAAKIPHVKCWVFGGAFLKWGYYGSLKNYWNYHVAIALPVKNGSQVEWHVIDPSTADGPLLLEDWAASITAWSHSYYVLKDPSYYVLPGNALFIQQWHKRNHRNFRWTMQGLIGINGLTYIGKAELVFRKHHIREVSRKFMKARGAMLGAGFHAKV